MKNEPTTVAAHPVRRALGAGLVTAGIAGLVACLIVTLIAFRLIGDVQSTVITSAELADEALIATADGLSVANASLDEAVAITANLETTLFGVTQAISDTIPTINTVGSIVGNELPATIDSVNTALGSAQATAQVVDRTLSSLGRLGVFNYNPEVQLSTAIGDVRSSLEPLTPALVTIQRDLNTSTVNLQTINNDVAQMAVSFNRLGDNVREAQQVIVTYQVVVAGLQNETELIREQLPGWFNAARWTSALLAFVLALSQLAAIALGWDWLQRTHSADLDE